MDPSTSPCAVAPQGVRPWAGPERPTDQDKPRRNGSALTLFEANLLVAMLGGFWARQSDGHPGPDLLGRGLIILGVLVEWERSKKESYLRKAQGKDPPN